MKVEPFKVNFWPEVRTKLKRECARLVDARAESLGLATYPEQPEVAVVLGVELVEVEVDLNEDSLSQPQSRPVCLSTHVGLDDVELLLVEDVVDDDLDEVVLVLDEVVLDLDEVVLVLGLEEVVLDLDEVVEVLVVVDVPGKHWLYQAKRGYISAFVMPPRGQTHDWNRRKSILRHIRCFQCSFAKPAKQRQQKLRTRNCIYCSPHRIGPRQRQLEQA